MFLLLGGDCRYCGCGSEGFCAPMQSILSWRRVESAAATDVKVKDSVPTLASNVTPFILIRLLSMSLEFPERPIRLNTFVKWYYDEKIAFIFSSDFEPMFAKHSQVKRRFKPYF